MSARQPPNSWPCALRQLRSPGAALAWKSSPITQRVLDAASDFSPADAANGTFQLFGTQIVSGFPGLAFIKTAGTATGTVAVHADALSSTGYHHFVDARTAFSLADVPKGTFHLFGATLPELAFIQTASDASGTVEVHVDNFGTRVLDATSDFSPADAANGTFQWFGVANGQLELGFIQTANIGTGTVAVHVDAINNNGQYQRILDSGSDFGPADVPNGTFQLHGLGAT